MTRRGPAGLRQIAVSGLAGAALAGAVQATDAPPAPLHFTRVGEPTAETLVAIREHARWAVATCRAALNLGEVPPPPLPDALLKTITYVETEEWLQGDRHLALTTKRVLRADAQSGCELFVAVQREAVGGITCRSHLSGIGVQAPGPQLTAAPVATNLPKVTERPAEPGRCKKVGKDLSTADVPVADAGQGIPCVWNSTLMWANLNAAQRAMAPNLNPGTSGNEPSPTRGDACLYAKRTSFQVGDAPGYPVIVRNAEPKTGLVDNEGMRYMQGNMRLTRFEEGVAIPETAFDRLAVDAFVHRPWREPLPSLN